MLEVLRAAQMAELRGEPARRISFRDIDVEQIGYIYEGLLGYSCADVREIIVGLIGKELFPLSAIVQVMRKTQQTSLYIERLGPFFVGRAAWQSAE